MKTGRPTLLTKEVQATIVGAILVGAAREVAAKAAGISRRAMTDWINRGREAEKREEAGEPLDEEAVRYRDFARALDKADGECDVTALRNISKAPDWRADAWRMERTRPERYAMKIEVIAREQAARVVLDRLRSRLSEDAFEQVAAALAEETWDGAEDV